MTRSADLFDPDPGDPAGPPGPGPADAGADAPLAERLRPRAIDEVIGQTHLLAPGRPLRLAFDTRRLHSMILWGPPGVGKTTLARLIAQRFGAHFIAISAVLAGVKEIREAVVQAQAARAAGQPTLVFVDEVHRFNKSQQDAFLPHVESGLFTFIGATTENPSFEVNSALLSRATVYVLQPLQPPELELLARRGLQASGVADIEPDALRLLAEHADGDGRRLLNAVEAVAATALAAGSASVDMALLQSALAEAIALGEKSGLDRAKLLDALERTAILSPGHKSKIENAKREQYPVAFALRLMAKDFNLIFRQAVNLAVPMPATAAAQQAVLAEQARGVEEDFSSVILREEQLAGINPIPPA